MVTLVVLSLLLLLVGIAVFRPLLSAQFDASPGTGLEAKPPVSRSAVGAKALEEQRDLREALAEGKISESDFQLEAGRIRRFDAASSLEPVPEDARPVVPARQPSAYPLIAVLGWGSAIALSVGTALLVERLDIIRPDVPVRETPAAGMQGPGTSPGPGDLVPDIAAMIGQLEARILRGEVAEEDIEMLVRSYAVLGRGAEVTDFLRAAVDQNPDHPVLLLALGMRLYDEPQPETDRQAEVLFDRVIASDPEHPVAHWFKSLVLVRRGEIERAVALLRDVQAMVANDPRASAVVAELIESLDQPPEVGTPPAAEVP